MQHYRHATRFLLTCALLVAAGGCNNGPGVDGSFDRNYNVSGHTRLDITSTSGDITIVGGADGKIHVHGAVHTSDSSLAEAKNRLADFTSNPPIQQTAEGLRIGADVVRLRNTSISYTIEVPRDTEISSSVVSGAQLARGVRGPVKLQSASGSVRAENIDGEAQLASLSGNVSAVNMGDAVRASSTSGNVTIDGAKSDLRLNAESGDIHVTKPGGRVEATLVSGSVDVHGATGDVKIRGVSGNLSVQGNPAANSFWELKNISGGVDIAVPAGANFHLLAEATSGEIRADIPIMIEEQSKHSLRAQIGNGGGRIEAHTVSGVIHLIAQ